MRACNISSIRMGEFSWASVEPERDRFDFSRFQVALDAAASLGIQVIFCTPTATPPKWLIDECPDILPITRSGQRIPFGTRRHYDVHNQAFRQESRRITTAYGQAFGQHEAVTGWQLDNEFGCHGSAFVYTPAAKAAFHRWLRRKFNDDIDQLNEDWFSCFWSQRYNSFEQIELPLASWADQNPHLELDFRRFSNSQFASFQGEQIEIIRSLSPGRFITHNFMTLFTDLCPWQMSTDLDRVGFDHYQMDTKPHPHTSFWQFALMRSLKNDGFLVLEQQPLQVNWHPVNRRFEYSWLFLWTLQAALQGAQGVYYFSWQRFLGGAEQYHDGIVSHDVRISETWQERSIKAMNDFLVAIGERFSLTKLPEPEGAVACVYDSESLWSHEITQQSAIYSTRRELDFVSSLCHTTGIGLSFVRTILDGIKKEETKLLILPGYAFELSCEEQVALKNFLSRGGRVLSLPRTAMKKRNNRMSQMPLSFLDTTELCLEDFGALESDEGDAFSDGQVQFSGELWAEKIQILGGWEALASFTSGPYAGSAAAIGKSVDTGRWVHMATCPPSNCQFFSWILSALGLKPLVKPQMGLQVMPLRQGDRSFVAVLNFSDCELELECDGVSSVIVAQLDVKQSLSSQFSGGEGNTLIVKPSACVLMEKSQVRSDEPSGALALSFA
jgi:beta-galactosidase